MKTHSFLSTVVLAAALSAVPSIASAQGRGRGHDKPKVQGTSGSEKHDAPKPHKAKPEKAGPNAVVVDRDGHVRVIREYAAIGQLPPGLAKREQLPPGLRAQLRENGALPPGLQKRLIAVPQPLIVRLPAVPSYYRRYFAGDDLIVVDTRANRVIAILPNVWR